ncbi:MAG: hypothetical protein M1813_007800 [Trichoglossum hirsutum]|nr:MAG: hypothetical protein M1813_007800 [Trichoglossum hirsutum]
MPGFSVTRTYEEDKLLWYSRSLLKKKVVFLVPPYGLMEGKLEKGRVKEDMSCMHEELPGIVDKRGRKKLEQTAEQSKGMDEKSRGL